MRSERVKDKFQMKVSVLEDSMFHVCQPLSGRG